MTLAEKYRIHTKLKSNKFLYLYLLIALLLIFSSSLARYITSSNITFGANVANWSIKVNDISINQSTSTIYDEIDLIVTENQSDDGLIKSGQSGYFDIVINPQYTEVSLKYIIALNMTSFPEQINLTGYSLNSSAITPIPANNIFEGKILLNGKNNLEDTDKKIYRIYWEWPSNVNIIEEGDYKVKANIQIEQNITNEE